MKTFFHKQEGFTLIEIYIVIVILAVLSVVAIASFVVLQKQTDLTNASQEITNVLKLAQSKTLGSESNSQYGVYFDTTVTPHRYVLFKGATYAARTASYDQIYLLPTTLEFSSINLGGGSEIDFDKLTGTTAQSGNIMVRVKNDTTYSQTVYIGNSGTIGFSAPAIASDTNRVKDSRHVHFDYSRSINTTTENLVLLFDNSVTQAIPISSNLVNGQINWSETVVVGGSDQVVHIHTHRLNSTDTQFSIHRDRRYNNKSLRISLSSDSSGSLIEYSADGATVTHTSIYSSNFVWQ